MKRYSKSFLIAQFCYSRLSQFYHYDLHLNILFYKSKHSDFQTSSLQQVCETCRSIITQASWYQTFRYNAVLTACHRFIVVELACLLT